MAREITKLYEEFLRGTLAELEKTLAARDVQRGEITLLIAGTDPAESTGAAPEANLRERMDFHRSQGFDEQGALKRVARERGVSKSEVYREWQREQARRKQ